PRSLDSSPLRKESLAHQRPPPRLQTRHQKARARRGDRPPEEAEWSARRGGRHFLSERARGGSESARPNPPDEVPPRAPRVRRESPAGARQVAERAEAARPRRPRAWRAGASRRDTKAQSPRSPRASHRSNRAVRRQSSALFR